MKHIDDITPQFVATSAGLRINLRGLLLPFTTPFNANEELNIEGLRSNIRKWNATGIVGYVALGSTGERVHLDEREYLRVIETAREEVPQHLSLIVGAGQESTRNSISEIKRAATAGADAVLVITPHFYRSAAIQQPLVQHYQNVADSSPVPVILYSMPDLTGIKIDAETIAQLSDHENIIGIKDSSADLAGFQKTVKLVPETFAVLTGNGTVFYDALCAGARGAILAVGCVATSSCNEIFRLVRTDNRERAESLQAKLTPLALAVTKRYGISGLKAALDMIGFAGGAARTPLTPVSEDAQREIKDLIEQLRNAEKSITAATGEETIFSGALKS